MIIVWYTATELYITNRLGFRDTKEESNKLWIKDENGNWKILCNALNKLSYAFYPDQPVNIPQEWDEITETWIDLPVTITELNLVPLDSSHLPHSVHIGKLISVNPDNAKPAVVRRWFMGESYDVACIATEQVKDDYQSNKLNINDWVLVAFVDEVPFASGEEINVACIFGKIWESWV